MPNEEAKLFVAGLPDSISEDVLKQIFEATGGTVVNVSLPKDRQSGRPRGFGFVTLSTPGEAQNARDALDGSIQAGKSISVRPFQAEPPRRGEGGGMGAGPNSSGPRSGPRAGGPGGGAAPDRTLYVGNLPYDCTQAEIETLINGVINGQGEVLRVHLPTDPDGRKRGFGFVTMASAETAKTAADALKTADLRGRRLVVNLAHPKGERPARPEGGGGGGYMGGGGGFGGGGGGGYGGFNPAASFGGGAGGPPPPARKTFDERRKKHGGPSHNEDGPRKRRFERDDRGRDDDWTKGDDD
ncbi:RNA recognition motif domain-containing protein [Pendulispora albinea]|uniref:RRM domain-containing protein n=1 Tax=Pendulispora albinea TaxID=2741071 RepID=A0ABZ2LR07_9BACT